MKNTLFLLAFICFGVLNIYAQNELAQLAITEVKLGSNTQDAWIEIFNPTEKPLVLNSFRISGVKTLNILPPEIRKQNGITIEPWEYLIICSNIKNFVSTYNVNFKLVEIKSLENIEVGGFLTINNLDTTTNSMNVIRFENNDKSNNLKDEVGDNQILYFSNDGMSYSRNIKSDGRVSTWLKSIPTPGK